MPKYSYRCSFCNQENDFYHSMMEEISDCPQCGSEATMIKLPSNFSLFKNKKQAKTGDLVKAAIAENNEELKQEKQKLREIVYEPDK